MIYLNENDPGAAAWLRELIKQGHLPDGHVDDRSIADVQASDLKGYSECHFFAGIGGWPLAIYLARRAGARVLDNVWTGSCPCQPFSSAGQQKGLEDERHLWPIWFDLIRQCRPAAVFGEQVASKAADPWLDHVQTDMEAVDYAFAACAFPAASVGAPHIRDRTYWVGYANDTGLEGFWDGHQAAVGHRARAVRPAATASEPLRLADSYLERFPAAPDRELRDEERDAQPRRSAGHERPGPTNGFWGTADWLFCRDGKWRPVESGIEPLVARLPERLVLLCTDCFSRGYLNESMLELQHTLTRDEGCKPAKVLQSRVPSETQDITGTQPEYRASASSKIEEGSALRAMQFNRETTTTPQRQESTEQRTKQYRSALLKVSSQRASATDSGFSMRGLQNSIHSGESSQQTKQVMQCRVCSRVGSSLRKAALASSRVVRLRGYGNAIVIPEAVEFILAADEGRRLGVEALV